MQKHAIIKNQRGGILSYLHIKKNKFRKSCRGKIQGIENMAVEKN